METTTVKMPLKLPKQHQAQQPGIEREMNPKPIYDNDEPGLARLAGKVALITGGDSGIGRAVSIQYAKKALTFLLPT